MKETSPTATTSFNNLPADVVSAQELKLGMVHAARLVRRYGMIYWPVVERLQSEIAKIEAREALLDKLLNG